MHVLTIHCLLVVGISFLAPTVQAAPDRGSNKRVAYFIQTSIPDDFKNPTMVKSGNDTMKLALSKRRASKSVPIPSDGQLQLVEELPTAKVGGEVTYRTLAQILVPEDVSRALILMHPIRKPKENGPVFRAKVLPISRFLGGDQVYLNLTNERIGVEIADEKLTLVPGALKVLSIGDFGIYDSIPFRYSYYDKEKQRLTPISASMTVASPDRCEVILFVVSEYTGRLRSKSIKVPLTDGN